MTWFADELIAAATPAMLTAVRADSRLAAHAYVVPPRDISRLRFGDSGLLFVRTLCDATGNAAAFDWYDDDDDALDSQSFFGDADVSALHEAASAYMADEGPTPPRAFLAAIKDLALQAGEPLVYYSCAMWGGDIEHEQAFVLRTEELAYIKLANASAVRLRPGQPAEPIADDALVSALRELGFELSEPYFEPHTRAFPWKRYALTA